jgi:hypothetical protein
MKTIVSLFFIILVLGSCSDSSSQNTSNGQVTALGKENWKYLLVTTTDFQAGRLAVIGLETGQVSTQTSPIHSDSIIRTIPKFPYYIVVNRLGADNIQVLPSNDTSRTLRQVSVGVGSNPQDVAVFENGTAYVSRLNSPEILKINPETGATSGSVSLASYSDEDGSPEPAYMRRHEKYLWVALQRLDMLGGMKPKKEGMLVVIDTSNDEIVAPLQLKFKNPVTDIKTGPDGSFYLGSAGNMGEHRELDGGIEKFSPQMRVSLGTVTTEKLLDGEIVDMEILTDDSGVAIVSNPHTKLVEFSPRDGSLKRVLWETKQYSLFQLRLDRGRKLLYVADRDKSRPGIAVFSAETLQKREDIRFDVGLPPYQMELSE